MHPEFNETNKANDVALMRVSPPFNLDGIYVAPVCMPEMDKNFTAYTATATGKDVSEYLHAIKQ